MNANALEMSKDDFQMKSVTIEHLSGAWLERKW